MAQTLVCVKQVKQQVAEEWDESMPLAGDIIEGIAKDDNCLSFIPARARMELSSQLGKISRHADNAIWVKIRRGDNTLQLRVFIVPDGKLQKRFTFRAAASDRHIVVLADLTFEECTELQELSRRWVNMGSDGFNKIGVKYDWKMNVDRYLPDERTTVVSSILFIPMSTEHSIDSTTVRTMAWFSASVSSGVPLVFVNIQTEQIITSEKSNYTGGKDITWGKQKSYATTTVKILQGIRLWFLPGIAEISIELKPEADESRFGMDIKRTEEGFIYIWSVTNGTAAERAGLRHMVEQAKRTGHLLVLSRLEGKSLMPASVTSAGLINCCDNGHIRETLMSAMDQNDTIKLHLMSSPSTTNTTNSKQVGGGGGGGSVAVAATLRPPY